MKRTSRDDPVSDDDLDDALLSSVKRDEPAPKKQKMSPERESKPVINAPEKQMVREEDFDDGYDGDLMGDEADKHQLQLMSDFDREQVIFQRWERREKLQVQKEKARREGRLLPRAAAIIDQKPSARGKRSTSGVKTEGKLEMQSALSDLKAKREAKKEKDKFKTEKPRTKIEDDDDNDSISLKKQNRSTILQDTPSTSTTIISNTPNSSTTVTTGTAITNKLTLQDLLPIVTTRLKLDEWLDNGDQIFMDYAKGLYVRVLVGANDNNPVYRFAKIDDIVKHKRSYTVVENTTFWSLNLKHGTHCKLFTMDKVSNSPVTLTEFQKWLDESERSRTVPTLEQIQAKLSEITTLKNGLPFYTRDMRSIAKAQVRLRSDIECIKNDMAKLDKDSEEYAQKGLEMKSIEETLKWAHECQQKLTKQPSKKKAPLNMEELNKKNRTMNQQMSQHASTTNQGQTELDPFARKITVSRGMFMDSPSPSHSSQQSSQGANQQDASNDSLMMPSPMKSPGTALVEAHNFELDLDITSVTNTLLNKNNNGIATSSHGISAPVKSETAATTNLPASSNGGIKKLSLADYKKKRGMA